MKLQFFLNWFAAIRRQLLARFGNREYILRNWVDHGFIDSKCLLTIDSQEDSFADRRWNSVAGNANIGAHLISGRIAYVEILTMDDGHWGMKWKIN